MQVDEDKILQLLDKFSLDKFGLEGIDIHELKEEQKDANMQNNGASFKQGYLHHKAHELQDKCKPSLVAF